MLRVHPATRGIVALLLLAMVATSVLQVGLAGGGLVRWAGYSVLWPVVAGALLPFRATVLIGAADVAAVTVIYGWVVPAISAGGRLVVIMAVVLAYGVGLVTCRVRLARERHITGLMVARDRLTLLSEASSRVGRSLDVSRTARELAEVTVPGFADFVTVDLFDSVLRGEEPPPGPFEGDITLRRAAQRSVLPGAPEAVLEPGEPETYPPLSLPARVLAQGRAIRTPAGDGTGDWVDPRRAARIAEYDFHSGIAVPLRARNATLGVVAFGRHRRPDPFDADDVLLAEEVAARAAVCLDNARRYTHEHTTSLTLQRSLLPRRTHALAAVEVASRYVPAGAYGGVGGDWFDVIPLSSARVALVVGDVVGHGLLASAAMGRLRAAVRTLADIDLPPEELLTHLDDVVLRLGDETGHGGPEPPGAFGTDVGATCLYAVYDPVSRRCWMARAGHLLPALVTPDGEVRLVDLPSGPPLGLGGLAFESAEVLLPEGSVLALYTDGLVESRHRDIDHGICALRGVLGRPAPSLDALCETVVSTLLDGHPADDVALLLARTRALDTRHVATWELPGDPSAVAEARTAAGRQVAAWGLTEAAFTVELVVSELVTNAIRYAGGPVQLRLIREKALICEVSDGSSTSPHLRRARTFDEGGRGLFIVANLTERWGTRHNPVGKTIWAEVPLGPEPAVPPDECASPGDGECRGDGEARGERPAARQG
ncbi:ATP-binding SpoIIE family protein phosphatase [Actinacidiphila acididurans]|uniref:SpoIIE family protein phosphatase n=1 Tax=Actinacidiphila acididurans TaxID=2784346 RepID=A0ABS2TJ08_9ACTN|nr:SpoIIE family protein phosphatase [Actinacidiphila acididurans]MBM9503327.1 SpoIIE family protein phosphatase [Actinacidiphila acididurans]